MSIYRRRLMIANALKKSDSNINYPGLIAAWSAAGKSNDDADRNVLRDLTGNGHDITLNNFAFNTEGSGYGGYSTNLSKWHASSGGIYELLNDYTVKFTKSNKINAAFIYQSASIRIDTYKITGLKEGQSITFGSDSFDLIITEATEDGVYQIDWSKNQEKSICIMCGFVGECNITIEVVPYYPDVLVFDGVDDYGINEEMPIQTDYTIIVKRKVIKYDASKQCGVITKRPSPKQLGAFWFERGTNTWSYGIQTNVETINNDITWQNKTSYNGTPIAAGYVSDTNIIHIGKNHKDGSYFVSMAFYSAYLFDRSLDEKEIKAFIRKYIDADYLLPSEQTTE